VLAEVGLSGFSVAEVARRLGVSTASPYRHFADRNHLLSAVATVAARDLAAEIRTAVDAAGSTPADRFAAATAAYLIFVARTGAGFNVIFAGDLHRLTDEARIDASRALMDLLLELAEDTGDRPTPQSVLIVEQQVALAHGYAMLVSDGFFARTPHSAEHIATRAADASRMLLGGHPDRNSSGVIASRTCQAPIPVACG
jgi:AcrR family transcriptional regulator